MMKSISGRTQAAKANSVHLQGESTAGTNSDSLKECAHEPFPGPQIRPENLETDPSLRDPFSHLA